MFEIFWQNTELKMRYVDGKFKNRQMGLEANVRSFKEKLDTKLAICSFIIE